MLKKNDLLEMTIEDMSVSGEGIGHAGGMTFFVKDALIGDQITAKVMKLKKNYGFARLMEIKKASPDRVDAPCTFARQCGGCQIQALSYEKQLLYKQKKVADCLSRIGGFSVSMDGASSQGRIYVQPTIGMDQPWHYRNKAQFPIGTDKEGHIVTGFYAGRTHSIIPNRDCALGATINEQILSIIIAHMEQYKIAAYNEETHKGLVRHVLIRNAKATGEIMVCIIINGQSIPYAEELADALATVPGMASFSINVNTKKNNVILGDEIQVIWGKETIEDTIGEVRFQISAKSFFQVNPIQTEKLYGKALEYAQLKGDETVWDLYCGIGTISLFLAQKAGQVYGVEIVPEAIEDAKINAKLNGIENAEFYVGKAEEVLPAFYEEEAKAGRKAYADVIVVDPPRKGCDEALLATMLEMKPERIVYVSCDPATLARDLKILCENEYQIEKVQPVDMFPHTIHVETVCLLSKK